MSISIREQRRSTRIHVKPIVEYATDNVASGHEQTGTPHHVEADVLGVLIGVIRIGSAVLCRDGKAGRIAKVIAHPQRGYPTHIIVRHGRLRSRMFRVAFSWVTGITPEYVELNLLKHELVQQPEHRPDYEIAEAAEVLFHGAEAIHDCGDYLTITATVEDGVVTLHGNVRNLARRLEAEQTVSRIRGVMAVQNFLFGDDDIAWKAGWVLQHDPRLQLCDLRIETCLGLVRLHGKIASESQRSLAGTIVKHVPGVHAINNGLIVEPRLELRLDAAPINIRQRVQVASTRSR